MPFRVWLRKDVPPTVAVRDFETSAELEAEADKFSDEWEIMTVYPIEQVGVGMGTDVELMRIATLFVAGGTVRFHLMVETNTRVHHFDYSGKGSVVEHRFKTVGSGEWHREALFLKDFRSILEDILTLGLIIHPDGREEVVKSVVGSLAGHVVEV